MTAFILIASNNNKIAYSEFLGSVAEKYSEPIVTILFPGNLSCIEIERTKNGNYFWFFGPAVVGRCPRNNIF